MTRNRQLGAMHAVERRENVAGGRHALHPLPGRHQRFANAPAVVDIYTNATLLQSPGIGFNVSRTAGGLGIVNILGGALVLSNSNINVVNMNSTTLSTTGIVNLVDGLFLMGNLQMGYTSNAVALVRQTGGRMLVTGDSYLGKERDTLCILTQEGGDAWYSQLYVGASPGAGARAR
jgi:hypothetical protein